MKVFDTALAAVTEPDEPSLEFEINERDAETDAIVNTVTCRAYEPAEGQVIMFMTDAIGRHRTTDEKLAAIVDFFFDSLDEPSRRYLLGRLQDRTDPFGIYDIEPITMWMLSEWSGRPTKQPSDYAPSRKNGGPRSTPRTSKSTSSASRRTAS